MRTRASIQTDSLQVWHIHDQPPHYPVDGARLDFDVLGDPSFRGRERPRDHLHAGGHLGPPVPHRHLLPARESEPVDILCESSSTRSAPRWILTCIRAWPLRYSRIPTPTQSRSDGAAATRAPSQAEPSTRRCTTCSCKQVLSSTPTFIARTMLRFVSDNSIFSR